MKLMRQWLRCKRTRSELLALDRFQLRDAGISEDLLSEVIRKPFWRV